MNARAILLLMYIIIMFALGYKAYDAFLNPDRPGSIINNLNEIEKHGNFEVP